MWEYDLRSGRIEGVCDPWRCYVIRDKRKKRMEMVVVSGSWAKHVANYPTPLNNNEMLISSAKPTMSAKAVLICLPNSHPFQDRTLTLDQPVKVGRSVARARATPTNAIFDCKVLSRHHALLWYDCGKFYLQDTKSSNGTFVNNNRLSNTESDSHEVCSGDTVQFGVDVVENNRKVTHCCIVATLKLYLEDGKEAKASPTITETNRTVPLDELYKLNQLLREASQRERSLENKMSVLQTVIEETRRSTEEIWQAYIGEERLLSRISTLENQLAQSNKITTDDRLKEELENLLEEKTLYQVAAKEALRKLHSERLEAVSLATERETAKVSAQMEATLANEQLSQTQVELEEIARKLMTEQEKSSELKTKLDSELQVISDLQSKLEQYKSLMNSPQKGSLEELEKCSLIYDYLNVKEEYPENHSNYEDMKEKDELTKFVEEDMDTDGESDGTCNETDPLDESMKTLIKDESLTPSDKDRSFEKEEIELNGDLKHVKDDLNNLKVENVEREDNEHGVVNQNINTNTLKSHFQSVQMEQFKKQMDQLKHQLMCSKNRIAELENDFETEKENGIQKFEECSQLRHELGKFQQKVKESCAKWEQMNDKDVNDQSNSVNLDSDNNFNVTVCKNEVKSEPAEETDLDSSPDKLNSSFTLSYVNDQVAALEEELVVLKERYAEISNEKVNLNKSLITMQERYSDLCNRSYNSMFFYIAPLVLMVLYLLISQYFS